MKAYLAKTVDGHKLTVEKETANLAKWCSNLDGKKFGDFWRFENGYATARDIREMLSGEGYTIVQSTQEHV